MGAHPHVPQALIAPPGGEAAWANPRDLRLIYQLHCNAQQHTSDMGCTLTTALVQST